MKKKVLFIALLVAVLALLLAFGKIEEHRMTLEANMDGIWEKQVEDGVILQLDVSKGCIIYRLVSLDFPELGETLAEYQWRARSHNSIGITMTGGQTRILTAMVDENVLTFSPALTEELDVEFWQRAK